MEVMSELEELERIVAVKPSDDEIIVLDDSDSNSPQKTDAKEPSQPAKTSEPEIDTHAESAEKLPVPAPDDDIEVIDIGEDPVSTEPAAEKSRDENVEPNEVETSNTSDEQKGSLPKPAELSLTIPEGSRRTPDDESQSSVEQSALLRGLSSPGFTPSLFIDTSPEKETPAPSKPDSETLPEADKSDKGNADDPKTPPVSDVSTKTTESESKPGTSSAAMQKFRDSLPSSRPVTPDIGTSTPDNTAEEVVLGKKELAELTKSLKEPKLPPARPFKIVLPILSAELLATARTPPVKKAGRSSAKKPPEPKKKPTKAAQPKDKRRVEASSDSDSDAPLSKTDAPKKPVKKPVQKRKSEPKPSTSKGRSILSSSSGDSSDSDSETGDILKKLTQKYKNKAPDPEPSKIPSPPPVPESKPEPVREIRDSSDDEKQKKKKLKKKKEHREEKRDKKKKREKSESRDAKDKDQSSPSPKRPRTVADMKRMLAERPSAADGVKIVEKPSVVKKPDIVALQKKAEPKPKPEPPAEVKPKEKRADNFVVKNPLNPPKITEADAALQSEIQACLGGILDEICGPEPEETDHNLLKRKYSEDDMSRPVKKRHVLTDSEGALSEPEDDRNAPLRTVDVMIPRLMPSDVAQIKADCRLQAKERRKKKEKREQERKSAMTEDGRHPKVHPSQKLKKHKPEILSKPALTQAQLRDKGDHDLVETTSSGHRTPSTGRHTPMPDSDNDFDETSRTSSGTPKEKASPPGSEDHSGKSKLVALPFLTRPEARFPKKEKKKEAEKSVPREVVPSAVPAPDRKSAEREKGIKSILKTMSKIDPTVRHTPYGQPSSSLKRKGNYTSNQAILMHTTPKSWNKADDILKNILDGSNQSHKLLNYKVSKKEERDADSLPIAKVKPQPSSISAIIRHAQSGAGAGAKLDDHFASPLERKRQYMTGGEAKFSTSAYFPPSRGMRGAGRGRGMHGPAPSLRFSAPTPGPNIGGRSDTVDQFVNTIKDLSTGDSQADLKELAERAADMIKSDGPSRKPFWPGRGGGGGGYNSGPVIGESWRGRRGYHSGPRGRRAEEDEGYDDDDFGDAGGGDDSPPPEEGDDEMSGMGLPSGFGGNIPKRRDRDDDFAPRGRGRGQRGFRGGRGRPDWDRDRGHGRDWERTDESAPPDADSEPSEDDPMAMMGLPTGFGGNIPKRQQEEEAFAAKSERDRGGGRGFRGARGHTLFDQRRDERGRGRDFRGRGRGDPRMQERSRERSDWTRSNQYDDSNEGDDDVSGKGLPGSFGGNMNRKNRDDDAYDEEDYGRYGGRNQDRYDRGRGRGRGQRGSYGGFSRDPREEGRVRSRDRDRDTDRPRSRDRQRDRPRDDSDRRRHRSRSRSRSPRRSQDKAPPLDVDLDELLKTISGTAKASPSQKSPVKPSSEGVGYISQLLADTSDRPSTSSQNGPDIPPELASEVMNIACNDPSALLALVQNGGEQVASLLCKIVAAADTGGDSEPPAPAPEAPSAPAPAPPAPQEAPPIEITPGGVLPPPMFMAPPEEPQPPAEEDTTTAVAHINQLIELFSSILSNPASTIHCDMEKKAKIDSMIPLLVNLRDVANLPGTSDTFDILPDIAQFAMELINEPGIMP